MSPPLRAYFARGGGVYDDEVFRCWHKFGLGPAGRSNVGTVNEMKWLLLPLAVLAIFAVFRLRRAVRREQQRQLVSRRRRTDLDMARAVLAEARRGLTAETDGGGSGSGGGSDGSNGTGGSGGGMGNDSGSGEAGASGGHPPGAEPLFQIRASLLRPDADPGAGSGLVFQRMSAGVLVVGADSLLYKGDDGARRVFPADDIARAEVPLADVICIVTFSSDAMFREELHTYFQTDLPLTAAAHLSRIAPFDLMLGGDG